MKKTTIICTVGLSVAVIVAGVYLLGCCSPAVKSPELVRSEDESPAATPPPQYAQRPVERAVEEPAVEVPAAEAPPREADKSGNNTLELEGAGAPRPATPPPQVDESGWFARRSGRGTGRLGGRAAEASGARAAPTIPGALPSPSEELWIIQKPSQPAPAKGDDTPGCGALMAKLPNEEKEIPLPLKHTAVQTQIAAYIATVDVTQQYHNPYDSKIEAVYVFPLPENAAVNEFIMTIGDRRIRGIIKEREEAVRTYEAAKAQGYIASLLTQERPNVFTQKVANLEPGKAIDVNIKYFHTLAYVDGWYEYVFPMVVGPRFNPPGSTDGIGAVARGSHDTDGQSTAVQYLKPGERSGHDISVAVSIEAGVAIEEVESRNHVIAVSRPSDQSRPDPDVHRDRDEGAVPSQNGSPAPSAEKSTRVSVKLSDLDAIPNKDFVLRYKVAGQRIKSALLTHQDQRGGFFSLMLYPPEDLKALTRKPLELIFLLDCSGSMNGEPIAQSKAAVERALRSMMPDDTFQIIRFSNNASQLGSSPLPATPENVRKGLAYLASLQGEGGTMAIEGVKAALDFPHDAKRLRFVTFLTDGFIGNEDEILAAVHRKLGDSRIFSFGVGSSPNRYFLDGLARMGRGAVAYLGLHDDANQVMDLFFERISHPAMTDLRIDWGGLKVAEVFPASVPDLFVGRPVVVTGRFTPPFSRAAGGPALAAGPHPVNITVSGNAGDRPVQVVVSADLGEAASRHEALAAVWARTKIADLSNRSLYEGAPANDKGVNELAGEIKQVALEYSLMSAYTAFVAVDTLTRTAGDHGTTVPVAVPVPDGVKYETTVRE